MTDMKANLATQPQSPEGYTGRRVWTLGSLIMSLLVLIAAVALVFALWSFRGSAIDAVDRVTTGIERLATSGRSGIAQLDPLVGEVRTVAGTLQEATDRIAGNVADRGLLLSVLPEESARQLEGLGSRIRATLDGIVATVESVAALADSVRNIPFVELPGLERVDDLRQGIQGIIEDIELIIAEILRLREGAATQIATLAAAAARIDDRLETVQRTMATLDDQLEALEQRAIAVREAFPRWITVTAVVLTLFLLWVIYAMVRLIRDNWHEWQTLSAVGSRDPEITTAAHSGLGPSSSAGDNLGENDVSNADESSPVEDG